MAFALKDKPCLRAIKETWNRHKNLVQEALKSSATQLQRRESAGHGGNSGQYRVSQGSLARAVELLRESLNI